MLLSIAQQRRQHLSTVIQALNGLAITIISGIWTFFLKSFLDESSLVNAAATPQPFAFSYIVAAAGISATVMALWRWYTKYLDSSIADIYPEILRYEQVLGIGGDAGVARYISKHKVIGKHLF